MSVGFACMVKNQNFIVVIEVFKINLSEAERPIVVHLLQVYHTLVNQFCFLKQLVIDCPKYVAVVIYEFRVTQLLNLTNYGEEMNE